MGDNLINLGFLTTDFGAKQSLNNANSNIKGSRNRGFGAMYRSNSNKYRLQQSSSKSSLPKHYELAYEHVRSKMARSASKCDDSEKVKKVAAGFDTNLNSVNFIPRLINCVSSMTASV